MILDTHGNRAEGITFEMTTNLYDANDRMRMDSMMNHSRQFYDEDETEDVTMMEEIMFYRYIDPYDHDYDPDPILCTYRAYRRTPKGFWIVPEHNHHITWVYNIKKKWIRDIPINDRTTRPKVYKIKENALYSYYRRKLAHILHVERKHRQLKKMIRYIERKEDFFGVHRPMVRNIDSYMARLPTHKINPLKKKRPDKEFINEKEFAIL